MTPSFESIAPDLDKGAGMTVQGVTISGTLTPSVDLRPTDKVPFHLFDYGMSGTPPHLPNRLTVLISIAYELRFVRYVAWHLVRHFRFDMLKDSDGKAYWIPNYVPN